MKDPNSFINVNSLVYYKIVRMMPRKKKMLGMTLIVTMVTELSGIEDECKNCNSCAHYSGFIHTSLKSWNSVRNVECYKKGSSLLFLTPIVTTK